MTTLRVRVIRNSSLSVRHLEGHWYQMLSFAVGLGLAWHLSTL